VRLAQSKQSYLTISISNNLEDVAELRVALIEMDRETPL